ncbi:MAG: SRPBCC domain-containing protein [Phycisphaerales bacterium]
MHRKPFMVVGTLALIGLAGVGAGSLDPMRGPTGEPQAVDASFFVAGGMAGPGVDVSQPVAAPREEVFKRFTTSDGWKTFLDADAVIDLRPGGPWEVYFNPETKIGSNGCQVLSYVPDEMVSFSWNAPPQFAAERAKRTWVVVTFTAEGGNTVVRLRQFGFGEGGDWSKVKPYFQKAWPNVLKALSESYEKK